MILPQPCISRSVSKPACCQCVGLLPHTEDTVRRASSLSLSLSQDGVKVVFANLHHRAPSEVLEHLRWMIPFLSLLEYDWRRDVPTASQASDAQR